MAAVIPANADPLLLPADVKAYRISVNPCGPLFHIVTFFTESTNIEAAVKQSTAAGIAST